MMYSHSHLYAASKKDGGEHYLFRDGIDIVRAGTPKGMLKLLREGLTIDCKYVNGICYEVSESSEPDVVSIVLEIAGVNPDGVTGFRLTKAETFSEDDPDRVVNVGITLDIQRNGKSEQTVFADVVPGARAMNAAEYCRVSFHRMGHGESELRERLEAAI